SNDHEGSRNVELQFTESGHSPSSERRSSNVACLFKDHPHEAPKQETQKSRCCAQPQCQHLEGAPSGHCGLSADDRSITNDAVPRWWKLLRAEHLGTKRPEINGEGDQWR